MSPIDSTHLSTHLILHSTLISGDDPGSVSTSAFQLIQVWITNDYSFGDSYSPLSDASWLKLFCNFN